MTRPNLLFSREDERVYEDFAPDVREFRRLGLSLDPDFEPLEEDEIDSDVDFESESDVLVDLWRREEGVGESPVEIHSFDEITSAYEPLLYLDDEDLSDGDESVSTEGRQPPLEVARRHASELAAEYPEDLSLFRVLEAVFLHSSHGQTRKSIRALLEQGATSEEIGAAHLLRLYWAQAPHFAFSITAYVNSEALPWAIALQIVRSFVGLPDEAELEGFCEYAFEDYCKSAEEPRRSSFAYYLRDRLLCAEPPGTILPWVHLGQRQGWEWAWPAEDAGEILDAGVVHELAQYGLTKRVFGAD